MTMCSAIGRWLLYVVLALGVLTACGDAESPGKPAAAPPASELVVYGYAEDMSLSILDAFTGEFGVKVHYGPYDSPEESRENIQAGKPYDVAIIENQLISPLAEAGMLARIDYATVPNFRNITANFRDLAIDPGNAYSIPCSYGTTGLLVRTDLVGHGLRRFSDLWDPQYAGKIGLRDAPREVIGMTLLSLGYAFDSENPQELDAARTRLLQLKPSKVMVDVEASAAVPRLLSGEIAILHGYAEDYRLAREANPAVSYILPEEGTALWGDSYVIPANSPRKHAAETLINFLLRPENAAQEIAEKGYAQPNDAALRLIKPEIRDDPVIYPTNKDLQNGHLILSLSPEGERRYADIWAQFLEDDPKGLP